MTFISKEANAGKLDPGIFRGGKGRKDDTRSKGEIKEQEMLRVLRSLKSHVSKSIMTSARIIDKETAKDVDKLAASKFLLTTYLQILEKAYPDDDKESEGEDIQKGNLKEVTSAPVFSLNMITRED